MESNNSQKNRTTKRAAQQQRARNRIDSIFRATEDVIVADGYENLRIVRIAQCACITHGSIYQYFDSVDDILEKMLACCVS